MSRRSERSGAAGAVLVRDRLKDERTSAAERPEGGALAREGAALDGRDPRVFAKESRASIVGRRAGGAGRRRGGTWRLANTSIRPFLKGVSSR